MTEKEFIKRLEKIDVFTQRGSGNIPLDRLYNHFEVIVDEFNRLEDIEDDTIQMRACIDGHRESVDEKIARLSEELSALVHHEARGSGKPITTLIRMHELAYALQILEELKDEF